MRISLINISSLPVYMTLFPYYSIPKDRHSSISRNNNCVLQFQTSEKCYMFKDTSSKSL